MSPFRQFFRNAFGRGLDVQSPGLEALDIRPMTLRDVDAAAAIEHLSFGSPWRVGSFFRAVNEAHQHFYVAVLDRTVVGYGGFWVEHDRAHVAKVAVHPDHRRRGIGTAIVERLLDEICKLGLRRAYLEVRKSNRQAQQLYQRFGFRFERVQPRAYPNDGEDALVFVLPSLHPTDSGTDS